MKTLTLKIVVYDNMDEWEIIRAFYRPEAQVISKVGTVPAVEELQTYTILQDVNTFLRKLTK